MGITRDQLNDSTVYRTKGSPTFKDGSIVMLDRDDGTTCPYFHEVTLEGVHCCNLRFLEVYPSPRFKAMKFFIHETEDRGLCLRVLDSLDSLGYRGALPNLNAEQGLCQILMTNDTGHINSYTWHCDPRGIFSRLKEQEINIDWMRTPEPLRTTVTVGDKKYYEDELAEALSGINAIN